MADMLANNQLHGNQTPPKFGQLRHMQDEIPARIRSPCARDRQYENSAAVLAASKNYAGASPIHRRISQEELELSRSSLNTNL